MLKCTFVGEILTPLLDIRTQWVPLSADIDKRSNAEADDGTAQVSASSDGSESDAPIARFDPYVT